MMMNNKQIFHVLISNILLNGIEVSIGINYDEYPEADGNSTFKIYSIENIGDLSFCDAYESYSLPEFTLKGEIVFNQKANFQLLKNEEVILSFENGILL